MKTTLMNIIKVRFKLIYGGFESLFKPLHVPFSKKKKEIIHFKKMNRIMTKYYKHPELEINDYENVKYFNFKSRNDEKNLSGMIYEPHPESKKWLVACHWFAGNKLWGLFHAKPFIEMGYNVIAFDFRGHGDSDKDTPTMGIKETWDLLGALDWVKENIDYDHLALMGTSMGSYVVNYASIKYAEEMKKFNVKFGVSDCPYGSIESLFLHERNVYLKLLPKRDTKKWVRKIMDRHNKYEAQFNVNLYDGNVFKMLESGMKPAYPIFFNHSKNDLVTPVTDTYQLLLERSWYIDGDELNVFNYAMHTQSLRIHFKYHTNNIARYIAKQDGNWDDYNELVSRWKLNEIITKQDKKSDKLA